MKPLVIVLLLLASAACFVGAWLANRRYTKYLDGLGSEYGCRRWPGETNNGYYQRLRARIGWS